MDTMTAPDLDALAGLLKQATPGPWRRGRHGHFGGAGWTAVVMDDEGPGEAVIARAEQVSVDDPCRAEQKANAALIAAAVNALPALLATAREMERLTAHWCLDGETLAERLQRERDDSLALMGQLAREKEAHMATAARECQWEAALAERDALRAREVFWKRLLQHARVEIAALADQQAMPDDSWKPLAARIDAALAEEGQDG